MRHEAYRVLDPVIEPALKGFVFWGEVVLRHSTILRQPRACDQAATNISKGV